MGAFYTIAGFLAIAVSLVLVPLGPVYLIPQIKEVRKKWPWEKDESKKKKARTNESSDDDDYRCGTDGTID